jgi:hypothetical protein
MILELERQKKRSKIHEIGAPVRHYSHERESEERFY